MEEYIEQANQLKAEADRLLDNSGIIAILSKFGKVHITGSYAYNLMTWRDIDLCLEIKNIRTDILFDIGKEISKIPEVGSMYFRNEFVLKTDGNPLAMFWCIDFYFQNGIKWKIDVLISNSKEVTRVMKIGTNLLKKIDDTKRKTILKIKSALSKSPEYRRTFGSKDIYKAVIEDNISTIDEWYEWLKKKKSS